MHVTYLLRIQIIIADLFRKTKVFQKPSVCTIKLLFLLQTTQEELLLGFEPITINVCIELEMNVLKSAAIPAQCTRCCHLSIVNYRLDYLLHAVDRF